MTRSLCALLASLGLTTAHAVPLEAFIIIDEKKIERAWVTSATTSSVEYKVAERATAKKRVPRSKYENLFFIEPASFKEAMRAFNNGNYDVALKKFTECETEYKPVNSLPNNYSTLSGFFRLECHRLKGDYAALASGMEAFQPRPLKRSDYLDQLELNKTWVAVHKKEWERLSRYGADEVLKLKTNSLRAQMGYCWGLACENVGKPAQALIGYAYAITSDYAASQENARDAVQRSLRIYLADESVKQAMKLYGTEDERRGTGGHLKLVEAGALANAYPLMFGDEAKLPKDLAVFTQYGAQR